MAGKGRTSRWEVLNKDEEERILREEENIRERVDDAGQRWIKVYFGAGAHFRNWLQQCIEIHGEENVEVEEVHVRQLTCLEAEGGKAHRIWVRVP
jgi:hypothetical protein